MIQSGYHAILDRVHATATRVGRVGQVRLLAVSKVKPVESLQAAAAEGCVLFGENYVQEMLGKVDALPGVVWHFIGHLQTNKVKLLLPHVALIHTVDRRSLVREISKRARQLNKEQPVLLEVNLGGESSKAGVAPGDLMALAEDVVGSEGLLLKGLMAIPPAGEVAEDSRPYFRQLRALKSNVEFELGLTLPELSMGMSADFEVAIEEGATLVRVGTAIFGARSPKSIRG